MSVSRASVAKPTRVISGMAHRARTAASPSEVVPLTAWPRITTASAAAASGRRDISAEAAPYARTHHGARAGRSSGQGCLALPTRLAGDPDQRSAGGTLPDTAEPAAIS